MLKIGRYWPWKTLSRHFHMPVQPMLLHCMALVSFWLFCKNWATCKNFSGKWFTAPPGRKLPVRLWSDWCVQLRFEFVYPYHAHHKTAAAEPLTIPTTDWKSFNDDKLANYRLLNSFKKINVKKSSKNLPSFSTTLQQVFRKLLEHFGMVLGHFPKSQS